MAQASQPPLISTLDSLLYEIREKTLRLRESLSQIDKKLLPPEPKGESLAEKVADEPTRLDWFGQTIQKCSLVVSELTKAQHYVDRLYAEVGADAVTETELRETLATLKGNWKVETKRDGEEER